MADKVNDKAPKQKPAKREYGNGYKLIGKGVIGNDVVGQSNCEIKKTKA